MTATPTDYQRLEWNETSLTANGNRFDLTTPEGRMAARAYAYTVGAEGDTQTKRAILRVVKRDDG